MGKLLSDDRLRRLYMNYLNDGIADIFAGWIIFFAGLMLFTELFWMAGVYVAVFLPIVWSIKEKVTMPRLRREELNPKLAERSTRLLLGFLILGLLALLLGLVTVFIFGRGQGAAASREVTSLAFAGLIAVAVLGGFVVVGSIHRSPRWYGYPVVAVAFGWLAWGLGIDLPWVLMAFGAVMAATGSLTLARFLRSHPVLPDKQRPVW